MSTQDITATTEAGMANVCQMETEVLAMPQVPVETSHVLHAGVYARTVMIPAGCVMTGALIKIDTVVVIQGAASFYVGDDVVYFEGYNVVPASAGRKTVVYADEDTWVTMFFQTTAKTVEEAEEQFTDETGKLGSRKHGSGNVR